MTSIRYRFPFLAAFCALLAICLFAPGLGGGFIFDDRPNIQENGALHVITMTLDDLLVAAYSYQPGNGTRSLSMLSFALDFWRGNGLDPRVFKATNLAIHALTAFALMFFFRQLLLIANWPARRAALAAIAMATFWAIHPLQVSSVLYVVQRMQTLGTLFLVLSLWAYVKARHAQMHGTPGRTYMVLTLMFWTLAIASKEDSALLPAYALVLELTVLQFRAAQPALAQTLRRGYLLATLAGTAAYLLVVLPHYWSWGEYPGRTFSSAERLLTQGRVLVMYLGQIAWPLPDRMPFFYDDLRISRGLLDPLTTLVSCGMSAALLFLAWRWRTKRPVFACGVFLFFAGHFVTSNVLNLELAFEHRNHFPMIGAALAIGAIFIASAQRLRLSLKLSIAVVLLAYCALAAATISRAHQWGDPVRFAQHSVRIAPSSERAWLALGGTYADLSGLQSDSPYLDKAIEACIVGARKVDSVLLLSNVVNYKTIQGTVSPADWNRFHARLERVPMTLQNKNVIWTMIRNDQRGIPMDPRGVLESIEIVSRRTSFSVVENLQLAAWVFNNSDNPDKALPYLMRASAQAGPDDPVLEKAASDIAAAGRAEWASMMRKCVSQPAHSDNCAPDAAAP